MSASASAAMARPVRIDHFSDILRLQDANDATDAAVGSTAPMQQLNATVQTAVGNAVAVGGNAATVGDRILWFETRIVAVILIVLPIVVIAGLLWWKRKHRIDDGHKPSSALRPHKVKQWCYDFLCCGMCCQSLHLLTGFHKYKPRHASWLRVTFISAKELKKNTDLFFEVWTEPCEGWPKNTRIHKQAVGEVDFHYESVDLEWHGDEQEIRIHCIEYKQAKQFADKPIGELTIKREQIDKYTKEAGDDSKPTAGARVFPLTVTEKIIKGVRKKQRDQRFKNQNLVAPVLPLLATTVASKYGFDLSTVNKDELESLRAENQHLREINGELDASLSASWNLSTVRGGAQEKKLMDIIVRLELREVETAVSSGHLFQSASFHSRDDLEP